MIGLFLAAGMCELAGLVLAGVGFRQTWMAHGPGGSLPKAVIVAIGSAMAAGLRRIGIPIRRNQIIRPSSGSAEGRFGVHGVFAGMAPVPDPAEDPEAFLTALRDQLAKLDKASFENAWALDREAAKREDAIRDLRAELSARTDEVERSSKALVIDGIVLQASGWALVLVGVVLGTIGNVLQVA